MPGIVSADRAAWAFKFSKYSTAYRRRLLQGAVCLQAYLRGQTLPSLAQLVRRAAVCDNVLREFVIDSHVTSAPSSKRALMLCKHAVLFCQISWPQRNLPETWAYLNTWEESVPAQMRAPLPLPVLLAMCILARCLACQVSGPSANLWLCHAALLEVAFFTMLRPGELFKLRVGDVDTVSSWNVGMPHCTLRLHRAKNRRRMGFEQFVTLTRPSACNWLVFVTHGRRSTEALALKPN